MIENVKIFVAKFGTKLKLSGTGSCQDSTGNLWP